MSPELAIKRARHTKPVISLVPMVDVMLILLVFFMVTSTYLNLDMIPTVQQQEQGNRQPAAGPMDTVLIRLSADGAIVANGQPHGADTLAALLTDRLATAPRLQVLLLPSGRSSVQDLISTMDTITGAGVSRMRIIRLEERP